MHTLSALVADHPGVLARFVGQFARRGLNIERLSAAPTSRPGVSRVTVVFDSQGAALGPLVGHLARQVHVLQLEGCVPAYLAPAPVL